MDWTPRTIEVVVEDIDSYQCPTDAAGFLAMVNVAFGKIPEEHRASATVEICPEMSYDSPTASFKIAYTRLETHDEVRARINLVESRDQVRKRWLLAELERLKDVP